MWVFSSWFPFAFGIAASVPEVRSLGIALNTLKVRSDGKYSISLVPQVRQLSLLEVPSIIVVSSLSWSQWQAHQLTLYWLHSILSLTYPLFYCASWDHLGNKLFALKSFSQGLLLGKPNLWEHILLSTVLTL